MPPRRIEDYKVGWICALSNEMAAARATLEKEYEPFEIDNTQDNNHYILGRVGKHNVVMACLPAGVNGTNAAATVAQNMSRTFTRLSFGLMVGIGGGIPNLEKEIDIRLGDVVVSQPDKAHGGVIQYDLGKNLAEGNFERKGCLSPPPTVLLTALSALKSQHDLKGSQISQVLADMIKRHPHLAKSGYGYPGLKNDNLYCSNVVRHQEVSTCGRCKNGMVQRDPRDDQDPVIHYGVIASGNELIKNAAERDRLGKELGAKCVEMEAAGLMNDFPCLVIRGICDYADAHKNDIWQKYAATTAAAFAKELLSFMPATKVANSYPTKDIGTEYERASLPLPANLFNKRSSAFTRIGSLYKVPPPIRSQVFTPNAGSDTHITSQSTESSVEGAQLPRWSNSLSSELYLNLDLQMRPAIRDSRAVSGSVLPLTEPVTESFSHYSLLVKRPHLGDFRSRSCPPEASGLVLRSAEAYRPSIEDYSESMKLGEQYSQPDRAVENLPAARDHYAQAYSYLTQLEGASYADYAKVEKCLMYVHFRMTWSPLPLNEKIEHLEEAKRYAAEALRSAEKSQKPSLLAQVRFESAALRGREVELDIRSKRNPVETARKRDEVVSSIAREIANLRGMNPTNIKKAEEQGQWWIRRLQGIVAQ